MAKGFYGLDFFKGLLFALGLIGVILGTAFFFREGAAEEAAPTGAFVSEREDTRPLILLDAGHGGMDSGAVSVLGDEEKHLNLDVAKKLGAFLEEAGCRVLYTRTEDEMLTSFKTSSRKMGDLMARVDLAEAHPEAIFVSVHMNTLAIEKYSGLQVFYSENHSANKPLALQLQGDAKRYLQPENTREIKNAKGSIYILDRIRIPSVLVECGFLSNHREAELLASEEYRARLAFVLSRSIVSFALQKEKFE